MKWWLRVKWWLRFVFAVRSPMSPRSPPYPHARKRRPACSWSQSTKYSSVTNKRPHARFKFSDQVRVHWKGDVCYDGDVVATLLGNVWFKVKFEDGQSMVCHESQMCRQDLDDGSEWWRV